MVASVTVVPEPIDDEAVVPANHEPSADERRLVTGPFGLRWRLPPPPRDRESPHVLVDLALLGALAAFHVIDHEAIDEEVHLLTHTAAGAAATAIARRRGITWDELGLDPANVPAGLGIGALHGAVGAAMVVLGSRAARAEPLLDDPRVHDLGGRRLAYRAAIDIPVGTAVYEELVFRGAVLGTLLDRFEPPAAVAIQSVLFGLWHVLPALADRRRHEHVGQIHPVATIGATVLGTTLAGAWFSALRLRSGSVVAPMIVHGAYNVAGLLVATRRSQARRAHRSAAR